MTGSAYSVCIIIAGTGRRSGPFGDIINKCLLPYKGKAIISHIIEHFSPETPFVIALGYKGDQVQSYLDLMHPEYAFRFVEVDNYTGPGSGPGYSLSCCKSALPGPFYFFAGDGFFVDIPQIHNENWLGVSPPGTEDLTAYCNIMYSPEVHKATKIYDKMQPPKRQRLGIFNGLMFIKDVEIFWKSLEQSKSTSGEKQVAEGFRSLLEKGSLYCQAITWQDLGTYELYKAAMFEEFDFGKTNEFIYLSENRVVKFFANQEITRKRVEKARLIPEVFPRVTGEKDQFFAYEKVPGKTMYEVLDKILFERLLSWLKMNLWKPRDITPEHMTKLCYAFYHDKTKKRLAAYKKKYPDKVEPKFVNDFPVKPISFLLDNLSDNIYQGIPVFIHGDLQFDNIITDGEHFTLIDWRQDFAGEIEFGDLYYDLAKLLGGIYLNYDYIKQGLMNFKQEENRVYMDFEVREKATTYAAQLQAFVEKEGLDFKRVEILRGLIYLNMSSLHHPPFDRLLYSLAQITLTKTLT